MATRRPAIQNIISNMVATLLKFNIPARKLVNTPLSSIPTGSVSEYTACAIMNNRNIVANTAFTFDAFLLNASAITSSIEQIKVQNIGGHILGIRISSIEV
jgi:hypothetical protein